MKGICWFKLLNNTLLKHALGCQTPTLTPLSPSHTHTHSTHTPVVMLRQQSGFSRS